MDFENIYIPLISSLYSSSSSFRHSHLSLTPTSNLVCKEQQPRRKFSITVQTKSAYLLLFNSFPQSRRHFRFAVVQGAVQTAEENDQILPHSQVLKDNGVISNRHLFKMLKSSKTRTQAIKLYQIAKRQPEFQLHSKNMKILANYFVDSEKWFALRELAKDIGNYGLLPEFGILNRILIESVKSRKFEVAEAWLELIENNEEHRVAAYNVLMRAYMKRRMYDRTMSVYRRMIMKGVLPDVESYCFVMTVLRNAGELGRVVGVYKEMKEKGIRPNRVAYSILADTFGKLGRPSDSLAVLREMQEAGIKPDRIFYNSLIHAFALAKMVDKAQEIFEEARVAGCLKDPIVFTTMVLMYVDSGLCERAFEVVKLMKEMDIKVTDCVLCAIVNGYAKKRDPDATVKVFKQLVSVGCRPGQGTYACMINVYTQLGMYATAESLLCEMQIRGFKKCVVAYSNLISVYGKLGNVNAALRVFHSMKEAGCVPNAWVYNSLIYMYSRVGNLDQVEKLLNEMRGMCIVPNKVTYTSVILGYNKVGQFNKAIRLFYEYRKDGGNVDRPLAGIMVNAFSKSDRLNELLRFLKDIHAAGLELDFRLHRSALNALLDSGLNEQVRWFLRSFGPERTALAMN